MQVTFRGETKENVIPGDDSTVEQALKNAATHLERYGAETAIAAEYSVTDGLIVYLVGADDFTDGVHFKAIDESTVRIILEMFELQPLGDLAVMSTDCDYFGWAKSPEKFLAGAK